MKVSACPRRAVGLGDGRAERECGGLGAGAVWHPTLLCTYLSAAVLVGLVLNAVLGWSWADSAAGLVLAALAVREGRSALRGNTCCACVHLGDELDTGSTSDDCRNKVSRVRRRVLRGQGRTAVD